MGSIERVMVAGLPAGCGGASTHGDGSSAAGAPNGGTTASAGAGGGAAVEPQLVDLGDVEHADDGCLPAAPAPAGAVRPVRV